MQQFRISKLPLLLCLGILLRDMGYYSNSAVAAFHHSFHNVVPTITKRRKISNSWRIRNQFTKCFVSTSNTSSSTSSSSLTQTELGEPVKLKYTEYYENDNDDEEEHDPVILLHGLLGQKRNFASLGSSLSSQLQKKRKIFTVDLRNHGDNHHDWRDEMSYTHMGHDVLAFMDELNLSKAILIGHSMGGKVAKSCALQYPERISGLVVLDIAPVTYTESNPAWNAVQVIIDSLKDVQIEPGMTKRNIDQALRSTVEDPALRAFVLTNLEEDKEKDVLRWKININSIASQLDVIAGFDYGDNEESTKYNGDTFFINGGTSTFVKTAHMEKISRHFPNYMVSSYAYQFTLFHFILAGPLTILHKLTTIRGAGHWVHAEAPDDTIALLKKYLDR